MNKLRNSKGEREGSQGYSISVGSQNTDWEKIKTTLDKVLKRKVI